MKPVDRNDGGTGTEAGPPGRDSGHGEAGHPPDQSGYLAPAVARHERQSMTGLLLRVLAAVALVYCFLLAINMMGAGIKYMAEVPEFKKAVKDPAAKTPLAELQDAAVAAGTLENKDELIGRMVFSPAGVTRDGGYVAVGDKVVQARTSETTAVDKEKNAWIVEVRDDVLIVSPVPQYQSWLYWIFKQAHNPFIGLMVGILVTAVFQSSSFTTSLTVGLVASVGVPEASGAESFGLAEAIPVIMGANIGTSVTNVLVSLGFINRRDEFRRAFACATVHDFFNLLTVAVLFTVEMTTGWLSQLATMIIGLFYGTKELAQDKTAGKGGGLSALLDPISSAIKGLVSSMSSDRTVVGVVLTIIAGIMLFAALLLLVKILRSLVLKRVESFFDKVLFRNAGVAFIVGLAITAAVQSSSVTTSLVVPLAAAGLLTLNQVFPYLLGANIGTTFTALIAAFATFNPRIGLTLAMVHLLFNVIGSMIFYPLRWIPIGLAKGLAARAAESRYYAVLFILAVFFALPLVGLGLYILING